MGDEIGETKFIKGVEGFKRGVVVVVWWWVGETISEKREKREVWALEFFLGFSLLAGS